MVRTIPAFLSGALLLAVTACAQVSTSTPSPAPAATATGTAAPSPSAAASPARPAPPIAGEKLQPKLAYNSVHTNGAKIIALTFDDGPSAENTPRLLEILAERKIRVTFFLVGQNVAEYPKLVARELAEGHEVGDHSWSHPQLTKMSDEAVRSQILRTQEAIENACGHKTLLLRPPYGAITARQKQWIHDQLGFNIIMWSVDPLDWKIRSAAHVQAEILKQTHPGAIILAHDIHKTTVDAMPATLDALLADGYRFVTVSELLAMDSPAPAASPAASASSSTPAAKKAPKAGSKPSATATLAPVEKVPPQ